ncbi:polyphosphate:AMP phosphotransferase [Halopseudomonas bauzanensis]|uniref:polyphosphate:AMP phosphotransferase n=1 Tax=Halopseudomonas bauzanensis TaxID=653930 RepID=UPI003524CEF5
MPERSISKGTYKQQHRQLTEALLEAQYALRKANKGPVLVLISGNDEAGKAEIIYRFYESLDNRYLNTRAFALPQGVEQRMPHLWRYWISLPKPARLGFYLGSWYHQPQIRYCRGELDLATLRAQMEDIARFERLLADEGIALVKLWLQVERPAESEAGSASSEQTVAMREWGSFSEADYARVQDSFQLISALTSTDASPWITVSGDDEHERDLRVGRIVLERTQQLLAAGPGKMPTTPWRPAPLTQLQQLDYDRKLDKARYKEQLAHYQARLRELVRQPAFAERSLLLVFEGTDAAGKGGAIRRISQCLDPRYMRVHGTRAPNSEERHQPYLLRFWKRVPLPGQVTIFDRSYYGRVLVERVEGFCTRREWQRAYGEINDFEAQLQAAGTLVVKFWLAITPEEQLQRFQARAESPLKRYKLTDEDWRNRDQWPQYEQALNDMVERTSTATAPWHVIPAEDKRHARIRTLELVCAALQKALK